MKRARVSEVWNYFTVDSEENKLAKCTICQSKFSFKGTISNLNKHLKNKHFITVPTQNSRQEQEVISTRPLTLPVTESNADVEHADNFTLPGSSQTVSVPSVQTTSDPQASNKIQSTLRMFANTKKLSTKQRKEIDDSLMLLFSKSFLPFSIVEDGYFQNFVAKLNPAYQLPSRKHVSNTLLDAEYHNCSNKVRGELSNVDYACLTIDCWTSRAQEGYLAVTTHYIDKNFNLETALLQCRILSGPHTAVNLSTELNEVINDWNLTKKFN
ncbi:unnamed protein product [Parnassius apollo]|uniref:(apollo) hypothetical protein n=1 Tax=Parnassius apollo TaxID=110799 RepID=A0A8S3X3Q7_PARAO|nr:unnamed protein product [Parnassius apollo]